MMVAFDLEEVASQGSLAFIQDFLIPTVLKETGAQIQGECLIFPPRVMRAVVCVLCTV